jgi:glycerol-3-phosphate O-acyltransferase/dihydroxyacetone phosphate acyltransferase
MALARGAAVGVFPEGTSHSEPSIVQMKEGAARAALEYARWEMVNAGERTRQGRKLALIPVGIVYTDKSHFQSRVNLFLWRRALQINWNLSLIGLH